MKTKGFLGSHGELKKKLADSRLEAEKLVSNLLQEAKIKIEGGRLLISPPEIASRFSNEIKRLKPEILIYFGHCPVCAADLVVEISQLPGLNGLKRHAYCKKTVGHYERWER